MSRRYYTPPPELKILPKWMYKYYTSRYLSDMIQWAIKEYNQALRDATKHKAYRFVKFLNEEYSPMRVLAEMHEFKQLLKVVDENSYNQLSGRERVFLRRAYELYQSLSI